MKIYLVGGAVRDSILNLPVKENDWVVVGSSIKEMLKLGFYKVGKNFPVFINPLSKEEYALARKEKKSDFGYYGFICFFSKKTSLLEDLYRRDLTINAIAKDNKGNIIDPYNGVKDIKKRIIKHISIHFLEDPLRVLRVARFYSYLYHLNFRIELSTFKLIKKISNSNELKYLSSERIWEETKKASLTKNPECYLRVLYCCNALKKIFPEIYLILKIDTNLNVKNIFCNYINNIQNLKLDYLIRFSSILYIFYEYFLSKYKSNKIKDLIYFNINLLSKRLKLSNKIKKILNILYFYYELNKNSENLNFNYIVNTFNTLNIYKNLCNFNYFINISFINQDKKIIFIDKKNIFYTKEKLFKKIWLLMNSISIKEIIKDGYKNNFIKKELILRQKKIIILNFY